MLHRPPGSKRAYTPCPYPTLFRSAYFFATARSVLLDKIRRDRIVRIESLSEMDALGLVDDDPGPERRASARLELQRVGRRSEEHTSELQSLMRISYAVFCLKKKNKLYMRYRHRKQYY